MILPSRLILITGAASALALGATVIAADKDVDIGALPPAVRATLDQNTDGAQVGEIELEDESGKQIYTVELMQDGNEREIMIGLDGKFLGEEADDEDDDADDDDDKELRVKLAEIPDAARARIMELAGGAEIKEMTSEEEDGVVTFEAEYLVNGNEHSLEVAADGALLEVEKHMPAQSLSTPVLEAIKKKFPAGVINEAEMVEAHFINVEISDGGKKREVKVSPSGQIMETEDDD